MAARAESPHGKVGTRSGGPILAPRMTRELHVTDHVLFIDADGTPRNALATQVWGGRTPAPQCNVLLLSTDPRHTDGFGRMSERLTAVVHLSASPSGAWCWCWPDEPRPRKEPTDGKDARPGQAGQQGDQGEEGGGGQEG